MELFLRNLKFKFAPFLISKEEYFSYIKTSQNFYASETIINKKFILILGLILTLCLFAAKLPTINLYLIGLIVIGIIMSSISLVIYSAKKNKWHIILSALSCTIALLSISIFILTLPSLVSLIPAIIFYLSFSHFVMLLKIRRLFISQ